MGDQIQAVITDIEGTTTPISFVTQKLFPYAQARLADFVTVHQHDLEVMDALKPMGQPLEAAIQTLQQWLAADRKETPLKTIQGLIWEEGYASGALLGEIYPDAADKLKAWKQAGLRLFVYSSGSVQAQKLLFGHSNCGDLTGIFEGYFDTKIGAKTDAASYREILKQVALQGSEVLFLSDSEKELDAALAAGLKTACLAREGQSQSAHPIHRDFSAILS